MTLVAAVVLFGCSADVGYDDRWDGRWWARVHTFPDPACEESPTTIMLEVAEGEVVLHTSRGEVTAEWLPDDTATGAVVVGGAELDGWTLSDVTFKVCGDGLCGEVRWVSADGWPCPLATQLFRE